MSSLLKHALLDYHKPAYRVVIKIGISEVRLSKICNGLVKPKENEVKKLADILGKSRRGLFPENQFNLWEEHTND